MKTLHIGVLAMQGAFAEHISSLERLCAILEVSHSLSITIVQVRSADQLSPVILDGLIIPGGESTTMTIAAQRLGLWEGLKNWIQLGIPTMGTCAGLILMANNILHQKQGGQPTLGGLDVTVDRNYYGRQSESFIHPLLCDDALISSVQHFLPSSAGVCPGVFFIRAPMIISIDCIDRVKILAKLSKDSRPDKNWQEDPVVAVQQGSLLGLTFHPELTEDLTWHAYFVSIVLNQTSQ